MIDEPEGQDKMSSMQQRFQAEVEAVSTVHCPSESQESYLS